QIPTTIFGREPEHGTFPHLPLSGKWRIGGVTYQFGLGFKLETTRSGRVTGASLAGAIIVGPNGGRYTAVHAGGDLFELWHADHPGQPVRRKRGDAGEPVRFRIFRGHIVPEGTPTHEFDPDVVAYDRRVDIHAGDTIVSLKADLTLSSRVAPVDELAGIHS